MHLPVPTDENLARWIQSNADIPGINTVGIQSTLKQGADLDKKNHEILNWRQGNFVSCILFFELVQNLTEKISVRTDF